MGAVAGGGRGVGGDGADPGGAGGVVFGGDAGTGAHRNDTWALSLGDPPTWTQLAPSGTWPSPLEFSAAVYDSAQQRLVVFGGYGGTFRNDVWALGWADDV